jgi:hypothetical protein
MKRILSTLALAALLIAAQGLADFASAKTSGSSGGSRSSFSSGSSSRSSSSGSWSSSSGTSTSKPSGSNLTGSSSGAAGWSSSSSGTSSGSKPSGATGATGTTGATGATSGSSWSNSSGTAAKSGTAAGTQSSSFSTAGASGIRKEASLKSYNDYNSKFGKSGNPAGATGQPLLNPNRTWSNYSDYRADRDRYYSGMGWRAPSYAYMSYPSFGFWDGMFLWMLLSHTGGHSFYYNNQNDPGVQAWRQEAEKLSQSNADLKKQLGDMDAKIDQMRKDGVPVKPGQIPEGLDSSMALAADKVVSESPQETKTGSGWTTLAVIGVVGVALGGLVILRKSKTA